MSRPFARRSSLPVPFRLRTPPSFKETRRIVLKPERFSAADSSRNLRRRRSVLSRRCENDPRSRRRRRRQSLRDFPTLRPTFAPRRERSRRRRVSAFGSKFWTSAPFLSGSRLSLGFFARRAFESRSVRSTFFVGGFPCRVAFFPFGRRSFRRPFSRSSSLRSATSASRRRRFVFPAFSVREWCCNATRGSRFGVGAPSAKR